jgi:hypothetical protein
LEKRGKVLQLLRGSLFENAHLGIPLQDLWPVRRSRKLSGEVFPGGMSVHVKAFRPETAVGNIIDLPMGSNVDRVPVFSIKRNQLFRSEFFHLFHPFMLTETLKIILGLFFENKTFIFV